MVGTSCGCLCGYTHHRSNAPPEPMLSKQLRPIASPVLKSQARLPQPRHRLHAQKSRTPHMCIRQVSTSQGKRGNQNSGRQKTAFCGTLEIFKFLFVLQAFRLTRPIASKRPAEPLPPQVRTQTAKPKKPQEGDRVQITIPTSIVPRVNSGKLRVSDYLGHRRHRQTFVSRRRILAGPASIGGC